MEINKSLKRIEIVGEALAKKAPDRAMIWFALIKEANELSTLISKLPQEQQIIFNNLVKFFDGTINSGDGLIWS